MHPSILWSILRGNGAHTPIQDLESYESILRESLTNPRWFVLHPDIWNKRANLRGGGTRRSCTKGSNSRQEAGSQLGEKKNGLLRAPYRREGGPPASKDYTIALVKVSETNRGVVLKSLSLPFETH